MGMSIGGVICGIVMIIMSFLMTDKEILKQLEEDKNFEDMEDGRKLVFLFLLMFSLVAILVSACGFCLKCCENRLFVCCYGLILLPTWIVVLLFGGLSLAVATVGKDELEDECNRLATEDIL